MILGNDGASASMEWDLIGGFYAKNGCYKKAVRKIPTSFIYINALKYEILCSEEAMAMLHCIQQI